MEKLLEFNLNYYILIQITDYGWAELYKHEKSTGNIGFVEHCIKSRKEVVNGVEYYKLQAHFVISTFGRMQFATYPTPIVPTILIPESHLTPSLNLKPKNEIKVHHRRKRND